MGLSNDDKIRQHATQQLRSYFRIDFKQFEKKFKIKTIRYLASSKDMEIAINEIRERHSTIKTIDTGAKSGHFINGDFFELDAHGNSIDEKKIEKQYIKLGKGAFSGDSEKVRYNKFPEIDDPKVPE